MKKFETNTNHHSHEHRPAKSTIAARVRAHASTCQTHGTCPRHRRVLNFQARPACNGIHQIFIFNSPSRQAVLERRRPIQILQRLYRQVLPQRQIVNRRQTIGMYRARRTISRGSAHLALAIRNDPQLGSRICKRPQSLQITVNDLSLYKLLIPKQTSIILRIRMVFLFTWCHDDEANAPHRVRSLTRSWTVRVSRMCMLKSHNSYTLGLQKTSIFGLIQTTVASFLESSTKCMVWPLALSRSRDTYRVDFPCVCACTCRKHTNTHAQHYSSTSIHPHFSLLHDWILPRHPN